MFHLPSFLKEVKLVMRCLFKPIFLFQARKEEVTRREKPAGNLNFKKADTDSDSELFLSVLVPFSRNDRDGGTVDVECIPRLYLNSMLAGCAVSVSCLLTTEFEQYGERIVTNHLFLFVLIE
jgi:hypothetical protein